MKRIIMLLMIIFGIVANFYPATLYTPNGKAFNTWDEGRTSYNSDWFENYRLNFGPGTLYPNSHVVGNWEAGLWEYNCHVFAWNNWQGVDRWNSESDMWKLGKPSPDNLQWIYYPDVWYTDTDNPIGIVSYISTTTQSEASVVTYQSGGGITHSARPYGNSGRYISKWGSLPIVNHPATEVPSSYGSINAYYKINPAYRPVGTGDPVGRNWQTISNALNGIPSGGLIKVLSGTQTLASHAIIPSGVTLTVTSNAAVNLNSYSIVSTGGTINSGGTVSGLRARLTAGSVLRGLCGRIQMAASYAGSTNEIFLENGNFNENVSIYNKYNLAIFGNQNYTPFGSLTVTACDVFQATGFGARNLYISNSGYLVLYGLNVDGIDQTYTGLYLYDCDTYDVSYLTSQYSQLGIQCTDGTEADIEESSLYDNLAGLSSFNGSNVNISNSFFCGTALDLTTYNFSSINSSLCYFDGGTPSTSGSNISHTGDQRCSLRKAVSNQLTESSMDNIDGSEFGKINSAYFDITKRLGKAFKDKTDFSKESYCAEYEKIIADYKDFIDKNPDSPLSQTAVNAIAKSCRRIDDLRGRSDYSSMKNYLQSVIEKKEYASIVPVAERQMVDYYRLAGDFTSAVKTADELAEKYENNKDYVCGLLYAKGLIQAYNLNQSDKAVESFTKIVKQYPDNSLVEMAENQLSILGYDVQKDKKEVVLADKSQLNISNHPNPFNPSTTIKYNLPKEGKVAIRIYDILGRQVAELVNDYKQAGSYSVLWNGKDGFGSEVSSGVYFYNIRYNDQSITKKMMLIR